MIQDFGREPIRLSIETLQDENATVVALVDHRGFVTTGSSKRAPGDRKNYPLGLDIAIARAMIKHGYDMLEKLGASSE